MNSDKRQSREQVEYDNQSATSQAATHSTPKSARHTHLWAVASIHVFERHERLHEQHAEHKVPYGKLRDVVTGDLAVRDRAEWCEVAL